MYIPAFALVLILLYFVGREEQQELRAQQAEDEAEELRERLGLDDEFEFDDDDDFDEYAGL